MTGTSPFAPRHIVAAMDFSDLSTWALRHTVLWAQHYGARVSVLHAPSGRYCFAL
jgi:hypothetical protein